MKLILPLGVLSCSVTMHWKKVLPFPICFSKVGLKVE